MMNRSDDQTMDLNYPENWNKYTFFQSVRHLIDFRGRTPLKIGMQWGGEILSLSANNVRDGYIDFETDAHYGSEELYKKWMTKGDCEKGDIIFTMEAPLGNVAQIPDNKQYILSQRVVLLKTNNNIIENLFLSYLMRGDEFQKELIQKSTGSTVTGIQQKKLNKFELLIPPIIQQQKIAKILSTTDNLIEKTLALINKYTVIKQGMMADLFSRGIDLSDTPETNPNYGQLRPRVKDDPELYKKTELGWIPKEWDLCTVDDISIKVTDGDHHTPIRKEEGLLLLSARNIFNGKLYFGNVDYVPNFEYERMIKRCFPQGGDILISCSGTIGRVCEVPESIKFVLVRSVALVKLIRNKVDSRFIEWTLRTDILQKKMKDSSFQAAQPNLFQSAIKSLPIYKCPIVEQKEISKRLDLIEKLIEDEKKSKLKFTKIKKGLMQDLLTAKVEVR